MRVFKSQLIRDQLSEKELADLEADFRKYKSTRNIPCSFGKDAPYDHPNSPRILLIEHVWHLHLAPRGAWPNNLAQSKCTSDKHLVYCHGAMNDDCYLLIGILSPNAHELAWDFSMASKLGGIAERFRNQF